MHINTHNAQSENVHGFFNKNIQLSINAQKMIYILNYYINIIYITSLYYISYTVLSYPTKTMCIKGMAHN